MGKAGITIIKGGVTAAQGFAAAAVKAGIKTSKGLDFALVTSTLPCSAAGTFTTNAVRASCVDFNEALLPSSKIHGMLCISGNANACTGKQGERDTVEMSRSASKAAGLPAESVLVTSTGIIGHPMPMDKFHRALPGVVGELSSGQNGGNLFEQSIMTTDTKPKSCAVRVTASGRSYVVGGSCKGSGMIHPNMATMLAFITSDAAIDKKLLNAVVKPVVDRTFNNVTVDGDTSTNDMVLVSANGASGVRVVSKSDLEIFERALFTVCNELCARIAADGEGATKRIEIRVNGGKTFADAKKAAKAIANSNLVKCAMFGNDPNWGRILCAIGYSGARFEREKLLVKLCGVPVCKALKPQKFDEKKMHEALKKKLVRVDVNLGQGSAEAIAHTCDFSYDYVKINAEYHT